MIAEPLEWRVLLSGYTFNSISLPAQYPNGQSPLSQLVRDGNGNLFGTTWEGGTYGDGTVFEIAAGSNTPATLVSFNGTNGDQPFYDSLTLDSSGNLYGTTYQGGSNDDGTVFEIKAGASSITTLATFTGTNGANPQGGVALDAAGDVFGTTRAGGSKNYGTIFEVKAGANGVTTLATFTGANGATPEGAIALDANGDIFGTTEGYNSTAYSNGTVFELPAGATGITTLYGFNGTTGANPSGGVTLGGSGNLYGTTYAGGSNNDGTVFAIKSGVFTSIASFTGANGSLPYANVTLDANGDLIGTAAAGGANNDGTVFEIAAGSTTVTTLASFNGTNGNGPEAAVTLDPAGNLFGTTESGGAGGFGAVFEIAAGSSTITDLASFGAGAVGVSPEAGLTTDAAGDVFGTTMSGGVNNDGTVFEIPAGTTTVTPLATFNGINGSSPEATLTLDASGNLFGTTEGGGANGDGTVFEIKAGTTTITTLASFNGTTGNSPSTPVTLDASGNLFGLSTEGGTGGGTVYEVKAGTNAITVLANLNSTTGDLPDGGLTFDSKGNLWGTTSAGGSGYGTVIEIKSGTTTVTKVASFSASTGEYPYAGLTLDASGNFWGTTYSGGSGYGTVFEVKSGATTITKVASFTSSTGENPEGGVTFDASGNLFGTTTAGGTYGNGTVYEIKAGTSTLTALTSFTGDNGASPYDAVTLAPNGDLFGTAKIGGAAGTGAVFVLSPITATVTDNVGGSSITKASGTAVPGTSAVYTLTVSNPGPFAATGVAVTDPLPTGVGSFTWSGDGRTNVSGALSDTIASLAPASSITYTITAPITASATGTLSDTATVSATGIGANNTATDTDTLKPQDDVGVTVADNDGGSSITPSTGAVTPGTNLTYTIVVSNNGPSTATSVVVSDPIPTAVSSFTWSGNGKTNQPGAVSNTITTLAPDASVTYTVVAAVKASATGTFSDTATVTATADPNTANNTATDSDHLFAPTTTTVTDAGGTYNGSAFPATAKVNGFLSLEGVYPQSTYYAGSTATGTPLAGAPSALGTYTVVAAFPGSADYANSTSAPVTFTIAEPPSLTVTTTQDVVNPTDGLTSLREAITYANSIGGGTINFATAVTGTITLNGTQLPAISSNVTINGPGANVLAISGNNATREFSVGPGVTASINGLTLTDAYLSSAPGTNLDDYGAAVLNEGSLTLSGDAITGNSAFTGGAVYSTPFAAGGTASLTILDSTISGNTAAFCGGVATGVTNGTSNVQIVNSTIAFNDATASQVDSGILAQSSTSAGVCSVVLDDDTVAGNNQGGVFVQSISGGTVGFSTQGSLFALNSNYDIDNAGATMDPGSSYNLVADGGGGLPTAPANHNLLNVNPLVAPLGSYGGPTQTIPLLPGSPAIGAGVPIAGITTDQAGYARSATAPSIGAYENEGFTIAATGVASQSTLNGTAFASPLAVTVSSNNPALTDLSGGVVTFTAPATGASATLSGPTATLGSGNAASVTATANAALGNYSVTAGGAGIATPAPFTLSNDETPSLIVTTNQDVVNPTDGLTSLREAIAYADKLGGGTITFASNLTGQTITLGGSQLELAATANPVTIDASDVGGVTVDGSTNAGNRNGIFQVDFGATVYLTDLTITNGSAYEGGGVSNEGTLTVTDSTLSNDTASAYGNGGGGGIFNDDGTLVVTGSTLFNDSARENGGGIDSTDGGTVTITNSTLTDDSVYDFGGGGGIDTDDGSSLTIIDSTLTNNSSYFGADFYSERTGVLTTAYNSIFTDNAPGGISGSNNLVGSGAAQGLGTLGNYGGPTQTIPLLPGSPAIGAGVPIAGVTTDQRGVARPATPDVGAYQTTSISVAAVTATSTNANSLAVAKIGDTVSFAVTLSGPFTVTGSPTLTLSNGMILANPVVGGTTLVFSFVVAAGEDAAALNATAFNAAGITPAHADYVNTTGFAGTTDGSSIQVITTAPTVTFSPASASGSIGTADLYTVTFNRPVTGLTAAAFGNAGSAGVTIGSLLKTSATTYTVAVTPTTLGTIQLQIAAGSVIQDVAGNVLVTPATDTHIVSVAETPSLVVTTNQDVVNPYDGLTSLREAIAYADFLGGNQAINFAPGVTGMITLNGTQLELSDSTGKITIAGPGANVLAVSGGGVSRVFLVDPGTTAEIDGLTITNGNAAGQAGVNGYGNDGGGGIDSFGTLTVKQSVISNNRGTYSGGGIYSADGASLTIIGSILSGNSVGGNGASEGGGIFSQGTLSVQGSSLTGNSSTSEGGGIYGYHGSVNITGSTLLGNSSGDGGAITSANGTTFVLVNSTLSGNIASTYGGAFAALAGSSSLLTATNSTIAGNTAPNGAGIVGSATLNNSVVADSAYNPNPRFYTFAFSGSNNLLAASTAGGLTNGVNGNIVVATASAMDLGALGNYGGPTQTIPLLPGSPAIGAGVPIAGITTDQTGYTRSATAPSIGAYENEGFTITTTTGGGGQTTIPLAPFATALGVKVSSNNPLLATLAGGVITFTTPATGASATFGINPITLAADGTGSTIATANGTPGSYSVTAGASGITNPATFGLTNAKLTPTITVTDNTGVFNGLPFTATSTVNGTANAAVVYSYFYASDTSFQHPLPSAPTSVGNYLVIAVYNGNTTYNAVGAAAYFNIPTAQPTVAVTAGGGVYTGLAIGATATVTGLNGIAASSLESITPTLLYYTGATASGTGTAAAPTNVGTYTVVATFPGSADYATASASTTFSITPAATAVTVSDGGGTYNGLPFSATGTVTGAGGLNTTPTFSFVGTGSTSYSSATAPTNAGTYAVTATYAGDANHTGNAATVAFTIAQATPTLTVADAGGVYNAAPYAATGTVTGVNGTPLGSPTYRYYLASDTSFSNPTTTAPTNVGSYVLIALSPVNANYMQVGKAVYFSITQAASVLTPVATTVAYGGSTTLTATLKTTGGALLAGRTVIFSVNGKSVGTAVTNASGVASLGDSVAGVTPGVYASGISVSFAGDGNSTATSATASLTVLDAPITSAVSVSNLFSIATVGGSFTQARTGAAASDFVANVNWGDGTSQQLLVVADLLHPGQFDLIGLSHVYLQLNQTFTVTVTISTAGKFGTVAGAVSTLTTKIVA